VNVRRMTFAMIGELLLFSVRSVRRHTRGSRSWYTLRRRRRSLDSERCRREHEMNRPRGTPFVLAGLRNRYFRPPIFCVCRIIIGP